MIFRFLGNDKELQCTITNHQLFLTVAISFDTYRYHPGASADSKSFFDCATAVLTVSACWYYYWWNACQGWASWPQSRSWESVRCNVWNLRWNLKQKPRIMKTRVTAITPKKIQIGPFLGLKWRIYKYVRVRAVRFWFLTILNQRDSFHTQAFFWFSYCKKNIHIYKFF